jgi:hypothetical protein
MTTSTQISGNSWVIKLDNASGTLTDISGVDTKATIDPSRDSKETYVADNENAIVTVGKSKVKIAIEIVYSSATAEGATLINAWYYGTRAVSIASRSIELYIPDTSSGSQKYSGEVKLSKPPSFELDASKAEPLILKAEFQNDGTFSFTTV